MFKLKVSVKQQRQKHAK